MRARTLIAGLGAACILAAAAPASGAVRHVTIDGVNGPGPAKYDKVFVDEFGPESAKRVLVLMPGFEGGAGDFTLDAAVPGEEDPEPSGLGDRPPQPGAGGERRLQAGACRQGVSAADVRPLPRLAHERRAARLTTSASSTGKLRFAKQWGLPACARRRAQGGSRGARRRPPPGDSGRPLARRLDDRRLRELGLQRPPGYKDVDGLVLIDGGLLGSFQSYNLAQAKAAVAKLDDPSASPFSDLLGLGFPEAAGLFADVGGIYARLAPTASATTLQSYPLLPAGLQPTLPGHRPRALRLCVRPRHLPDARSHSCT